MKLTKLLRCKGSAFFVRVRHADFRRDLRQSEALRDTGALATSDRTLTVDTLSEQRWRRTQIWCICRAETIFILVLSILSRQSVRFLLISELVKERLDQMLKTEYDTLEACSWRCWSLQTFGQTFSWFSWQLGQHPRREGQGDPLFRFCNNLGS